MNYLKQKDDQLKDLIKKLNELDLLNDNNLMKLIEIDTFLNTKQYDKALDIIKVINFKRVL